MNDIEAVDTLKTLRRLMLFDPTNGEDIQVESLNKDNTDLYNAAQIAIDAILEKIEREHSSEGDVSFCTMHGRRMTCDKAIESAYEQAARSDPKPLTLDELRERDGKPVWVKEITLEPIDGDYWGIVDVNLVCPGSFGMGAIISPATDGKSKFAITPFSEYDKTHVAYDHPPKEAADET